ncbi:MAG: DUF4231 domain-containing protein [Victivallales bacterium]|nr:DUF4231 domain-containing protein [Victivallales bacterium]
MKCPDELGPNWETQVMSKGNITVESSGAWDAYANNKPEEAIPEIYRRASAHSKKACKWYWDSIESKRKWSWRIRMLSFSLLVLGVVLPLLAATCAEDIDTLLCTQVGVASLAAAGLLQGADKIFGWSSGWLRYMTTVTAMEAATRQFELDWADYFLRKTEPLNDSDKQALFQLAKKLQNELSSRQSDETSKWCAEFNSGLAVLNDLIKSQRESAEKAVEAMGKSQAGGSIEVTLVHSAAPKPVKMSLDAGDAEVFSGTVWSKLHVEPGQHEVKVTTDTTPPQTVQRIAVVPQGGVARVEVIVP